VDGGRFKEDPGEADPVFDTDEEDENEGVVGDGDEGGGGLFEVAGTPLMGPAVTFVGLLVGVDPFPENGVVSCWRAHRESLRSWRRKE